MKKTFLMLCGAAGLTVALVLFGSHGALAATDVTAPRFWPAAGTTCLVKFRLDAVGQIGQTGLPLNPVPNASLQGKLRAMEKDWVVLTTDKGDVYIPMRG